MQQIDNEVSKILIELIKEKKNLKDPADRAIQTWESHFTSNLHYCDIYFSMYKWCEIMHHCDMTINILKRSRITLQLLAYTQLFEEFDFNQTSIAPLGIKALV